MKQIKKLLIVTFAALALAMVCPSVIPNAAITNVEAAVKINKKKVTLIKGQTVTLKITGTSKKIKWSSSKKSVATVSSNGKITAKKKGTATITAKVGAKKYTCTVKVSNKTCNSIALALKAAGLISGTKTDQYPYQLVSADDGVQYINNKKTLEIIKYSKNSSVYKNIVETKKIFIWLVNDYATIDATNDGYVLFIEGYTKNEKAKIIKFFKGL